MTDQSKTYSESLAERLREIMNILGLTVSGFAEFIGRDSSHIYGILNLNRPFSHALAEDIGKKLNVNGSKIFNLNVPVSQSIAKTESFHEFKKDKRNNPEYFSSTLTDRSIDLFISRILIKSPFLKEPRYLNEIELFVCTEYKKTFTNDQLSKALRYSVKKGVLVSEKRPIRLTNGNFGKRQVDVYWTE
ncbi:MAG: helix-turn-helix domain-containing protein [Sphingobacterium sp.]|jgi:transcriptional regulator with XRE-family HTH domain|nr:helix-turn-helix domain-containing protein [Sphingobacterium sp.]